MSKRIRVIVADDSAFIRQIVCSHLTSVDEFEIVGTACDGREAVDLVQQLRPDVVTLDVDMPRLSGIEALEEIMREAPTPIVMVSGVSLRAAETTLRAIQSGAVDFVLKYVPGVQLNPEVLRQDIISKVRAASQIQVVRSIGGRHSDQRTARLQPPPPFPPGHDEPVAPEQDRDYHSLPQGLTGSGSIPHSVVVIGASTGGPVAIKHLLTRLPTDFPAALVIVQHIPHPFTGVFAAQLDCQLPFPTKVAEGGELLQPRHIYIAPGDRHLLLNQRLQLELRTGPPISGHRPSVDVTMKSVAQEFPHQVFGVLLTGMGIDGVSGMKFIQSQGGRTFAQEPATCVVDGMPRSALEAGVVDDVAAPEGIADRLALEIRRSHGQYLTQPDSPNAPRVASVFQPSS